MDPILPEMWMLEVMDLEGMYYDRHIGFSAWLAFVQPCQFHLSSVLVAPLRDYTNLPLCSLSININVQLAYHSDAALIIEIFHASYFLPVSQFMSSGLKRLKSNSYFTGNWVYGYF